MTIFEKISTAIDRFKKTADRMGHVDLADALGELVYVAEWQHKRIEQLEKAAGVKPVALPTPAAEAPATAG